MEGLACEFFAGERIFGDKRLDDRLGETFNRMARHPEGTLPGKLVTRAELVGGYRMFNHEDVTHEKVIAAHRSRCLERLRGCTGEVLFLHDTTVLDYSGLDVEGLGQVGDGHGRGLYAHNSLAVLPDTREVVGLVGQILHKRAKAPEGEKRAKRRARKDRESRLWRRAVEELEGLEGLEGLGPAPAGVSGAPPRVTDVSDRGSDVTEYIEYEIRHGRTFIARSQHSRKLAGDEGEALVEKLHQRLRGLGPMDRYTLRVPAKGGGWRETEVGLAWERVNLVPPRQARGEHGREPLAVWAVIARELAVPEGEERVEWILLTNRPVESAAQARQVVEYYGCRWMVEDYHKAMKSGCGIEQTQMTTRHGLGNVIALLSVLAVYVLTLRCKARDERTREQPARLHEEELKVQLAARDSKHPDWREMTVWEFYVAVARMGGYVLNPRKKPPGWIVLWRGYMRLEDMCEGVRLMQQKCVQT
jgi:hypothetical protein